MFVCKMRFMCILNSSIPEYITLLLILKHHLNYLHYFWVIHCQPEISPALKKTENKQKTQFALFGTHNAVCQRSDALSQLSQVLCLVSPLGLH